MASNHLRKAVVLCVTVPLIGAFLRSVNDAKIYLRLGHFMMSITRRPSPSVALFVSLICVLFLVGVTMLLMAHWIQREILEDDEEQANINPLGYQLVETCLMGEIGFEPSPNMTGCEPEITVPMWPSHKTQFGCIAQHAHARLVPTSRDIERASRQGAFKPDGVDLSEHKSALDETSTGDASIFKFGDSEWHTIIASFNENADDIALGENSDLTDRIDKAALISRRRRRKRRGGADSEEEE